MLFGGARRDIVTRKGQTALALLNENEDAFEPHQFKSLSFILSDYKECMCFQRHRPIRKVERSSFIIVICLLSNLVILLAFWFGLVVNIRQAPLEEQIGISLCIVFFCISLVTFLLSICVPPGYLRK